MLDLFLRGGAHPAKGASVKSLLRADDLVAIAFSGLGGPIQPGELDQRLIGLRAAIAEENPSRACVADQPPSEFALVGIAKEIARVDQFGRLALDGGDPVGVAVAERVDRNARREIKIDVALVIPDARTRAAHDG